MRCSAGFLLVVTLLVASVTSPAEVEDPAPLALGISQLASGGMWKDGERHGHYRVLVLREGVEHSTTSVFAEWVWFDEHTRQESVLRSVAVAPLRRDLTRLITDVRFDDSVTDAGEFVLEVRDRSSAKKSVLRLRLGAPGDVRLVANPVADGAGE